MITKDLKITVLLGRGVEGVGLTKNVVELQKLYPNTEVFATSDKLWPRRNSMDLKVTHFKGENWSAPGKVSKSLGQVLNCTEVVEAINRSDVCLVFSVPSTAHPTACIDNFVKMLEHIQVRKSAIQVDHNIHSIRRNARLADCMRNMSVIQTHSKGNPFSKWLDTVFLSHIPLVEMGVGFNFEESKQKYWVPVEEKNLQIARWMGRNTGWKGPQQMIDFHNSHLRQHNFTTILEGLEASISFKDITHDKAGNKRPCQNYFRPDPGAPTFKPELHGQEVAGECYLYPPYEHDGLMKRLARSGFGADLMNFSTNIYGNNVEYCHTDSWGAGVVPIMHKHFGDHVIHRRTGNPVSQDKATGTLFLDHSTSNLVQAQMIDLVANPGKYEEYRIQSYEYWQQHCDAEQVYRDILHNALHATSTEQDTFSTLFEF